MFAQTYLQATREESIAMCEFFLSKELVFSHCHGTVDPVLLREQCNHDMCKCRQTGSARECEATRCELAMQYARECRVAGVILPWRSETFCRKCYISIL